MKRTKAWHHLLERVGRGMAATGALGIVGLAASLTATTVLAWSPSDYSLTTHTYTATAVPSGGSGGSSSTQVSPGQYIYDTATLAIVQDFNYVQSGNIEFRLYQGTPPASCSDLGTPIQSATVAVASTQGDSPPQETETVSSLSAAANGYFQVPAGTKSGSSYFWVATFNDSEQSGLTITTGCQTEIVTVKVTLPALSVTTQASPTSTLRGGRVSDSATVSNYIALLQDDSSASGSVLFQLFQGSSCTGTPVYQSREIALSSQGTASTGPDAFTPSQAGPYEWLATVTVNPGAGWPAIPSFSSPCTSEPLSVQASTGLVTTSSASPAELRGDAQFGAQLSDSATVLGGYDPTGTVTFDLYNNATCWGAPVYTDTVSLSGGGASSGSFVANSAGTWEWTASYSGDDYNSSSSSGCGQEPVSVQRATPWVSTATSSGQSQVQVGSEISDTAEVTNSSNGSLNSASGNVDFNLFDPSQPSCWGAPVFTNQQPLVVGQPYSTATSAEYLVNRLGTYEWEVSYSGDSNDSSGGSGCGSEQVDVVQATPSITTTTQSSVKVGSTVTDEAEITGGYQPDGWATVTFGLYSNQSCTDLVGETSTEPVNSNGDAFSAPVLVSTPGTYYWEDTYSGNSLNQTVTSPCQSEPVWVTKNCVTVTTVQQTPVTTAQVTTVSDTATVANLYPAPNQGYNGGVEFELFGPVAGSAPDCQWGQGGNEVASGWAPVDLVDSQYQASLTDSIDSPLLPGDYYWEAQYSGDAYNAPASAGCGELTVVQASTPGISTTPSSGGVIGTTLTDTAVVTPVITPDGTPSSASEPTAVPNGTPDSVHFQLFLNDPTCSDSSDLVNDFGSFQQTTSSNADGSLTYTISVPASGYKSIAKGTYYWNVIFTGDAYNNTVSSCGEPVSITTPAGGVLGATTPNTGADLFGPGLAGALAMLLGGLLLMVARRVLRPRTR